MAEFCAVFVSFHDQIVSRDRLRTCGGDYVIECKIEHIASAEAVSDRGKAGYAVRLESFDHLVDNRPCAGLIVASSEPLPNVEINL